MTDSPRPTAPSACVTTWAQATGPSPLFSYSSNRPCHNETSISCWHHHCQLAHVCKARWPYLTSSRRCPFNSRTMDMTITTPVRDITAITGTLERHHQHIVRPRRSLDDDVIDMSRQRPGRGRRKRLKSARTRRLQRFEGSAAQSISDGAAAPRTRRRHPASASPTRRHARWPLPADVHHPPASSITDYQGKLRTHRSSRDASRASPRANCCHPELVVARCRHPTTAADNVAGPRHFTSRSHTAGVAPSPTSQGTLTRRSLCDARRRRSLSPRRGQRPARTPGPMSC